MRRRRRRRKNVSSWGALTHLIGIAFSSNTNSTHFFFPFSYSIRIATRPSTFNDSQLAECAANNPLRLLCGTQALIAASERTKWQCRLELFALACYQRMQSIFFFKFIFELHNIFFFSRASSMNRAIDRYRHEIARIHQNVKRCVADENSFGIFPKNLNDDDWCTYKMLPKGLTTHNAL